MKRMFRSLGFRSLGFKLVALLITYNLLLTTPLQAQERFETLTDTVATGINAYGLRATNLKGAGNTITYVDPTGTVRRSSTFLTDMVVTSGSYANPAWLTSLASTKVTGTAGGVGFFNASGFLTSNSNFTYDPTTGLLSISVNSNNQNGLQITNNSTSSAAMASLILKNGEGGVGAISFGSSSQTFPSVKNRLDVGSNHGLTLESNTDILTGGSDNVQIKAGGGAYSQLVATYYPSGHIIFNKGDSTDNHPTDPKPFLQVPKLYVDSIITSSGVVITGGGGGGSGTVTGGAINWPGTLYNSPTTGTVSSGTLTFAPALKSQAANTVLGTLAAGIPSFIPAAKFFYPTTPATGDYFRYNATDSTWRNNTFSRNNSTALKMQVIDTVTKLSYWQDAPTGSASVFPLLTYFPSNTNTVVRTDLDSSAWINTGSRWKKIHFSDSVALAAVTTYTQNWDGVTAPALPTGFSYASNIMTQASGPYSAPNLLTSSVSGAVNTAMLNQVETAGSVTVTGMVKYGGTGIPELMIIGRGTTQTWSTMNCYTVDLVLGQSTSSLNGVIIGKRYGGSYPSVSGSRLGNTAFASGSFYKLSMTITGTTTVAITASVQRASDGYYLNGSGTWQATAVNCLSYTDSSNPLTALGYDGLAVYLTSGTNAACGAIDDFTVTQ